MSFGGREQFRQQQVDTDRQQIFHHPLGNDKVGAVFIQQCLDGAFMFSCLQSLQNSAAVAAGIPEGVILGKPIVTTDARKREAVRETLISLVKHAMVVEERRSRQLVH